MFIEKRGALRVHSSHCHAKINGYQVIIENISATGAKLRLPPELNDITQIYQCLVQIDQLKMYLPFEIKAIEDDVVRIKFRHTGQDKINKLNHAIRQIKHLHQS